MENRSKDDLKYVNQDLERLSLNDEQIRNQLNLNLNQNYNEHHIRLDENDIEDDYNSNGDECVNIDDEQPLTDLIVTSLPQELFTNESLKKEFENMFIKYADATNGVKFFYFRILKRCTIKYSDESAAVSARYELDNQLFLGEPIRLFFAQVCVCYNGFIFHLLLRIYLR